MPGEHEEQRGAAAVVVLRICIKHGDKVSTQRSVLHRHRRRGQGRGRRRRQQRRPVQQDEGEGEDAEQAGVWPHVGKAEHGCCAICSGLAVTTVETMAAGVQRRWLLGSSQSPSRSADDTRPERDHSDERGKGSIMTQADEADRCSPESQPVSDGEEVRQSR